MAEWVNSGEWPEVESEQRFIADVLLSKDLPSDRYKFWSGQYPKGTGRPGREREVDIVMLGPDRVWLVSLKSSNYPIELGKNNYLINGTLDRSRKNPWREVDLLAKKMKSHLRKLNDVGRWRELEDCYLQAMVAYETPSLESDGSLEICSFDQFIVRVKQLETKNSETKPEQKKIIVNAPSMVPILADAFGLFDKRAEGRNYQGERWGQYSWQKKGDELPPMKFTKREGDSKSELKLLRTYTEASHDHDEKPYTVVVGEPELVTPERRSEYGRRGDLLNRVLRDGERANFRLEQSGLRRQAPWLLAPCDFGKREVGAGFVEVWESTKFDLYRDKSNLNLSRVFSQNYLTQESEKCALLSELCEIIRSLLNAKYSHGELDFTRVLVDGEGTVYITEIGDMYPRTPRACKGIKESCSAPERDCMFLGELMGELWGEMPVEFKAAHELLLSGDLAGLDLLTDSLAGPPETEPRSQTELQPEPLGFEEWRRRLRACIAVVEFGGIITRSEMALELERQSVGGSDEVIDALLVDGFLERLPDECLTIASPGIEFLRAEHARRRSSATPSPG